MPRDGDVTELDAASAERIALATKIPLSPDAEELQIKTGIINAALAVTYWNGGRPDLARHYWHKISHLRH